MSLLDIRQKVYRIPNNVVLSLGLRWNFVGDEPIDLDLSAVCFTKQGKLIDAIYFNHPFPEGISAEEMTPHGASAPNARASPRTNAGRVHPSKLPYMFLSGDSVVGGEDEHRTPAPVLAARRRERLLEHRGTQQGGSTAMEAIFQRLYEEEELQEVQDVMINCEDVGGDDDDVAAALRGTPHHTSRTKTDEMLTVMLRKVPEEAEVIFVSITSYTGIDFRLLQNARLIIFNETRQEEVGSIDVMPGPGTSGTASLSCMLLRVPPPPPTRNELGEMESMQKSTHWDLRELNILSYGYTFVDVLPIMMDVLGVPAASRMNALMALPNGPLVKPYAQPMFAREELRELRFGVGWDGAYDVDAFLVMLDDHHRYLDHLYPKQTRLRCGAPAPADQRYVPIVAEHSGDAKSGTSTLGDVECIDIHLPHLPPDVTTILLGITYVERFDGANPSSSSIITNPINQEQQKTPWGAEEKELGLVDVPKLYVRLQNRNTAICRQVREVDRWHPERDAPAAAEEVENSAATAASTQKKQDHNNNDGKAGTPPVTAQRPYRVALLGAIVDANAYRPNTLARKASMADERGFQSPTNNNNNNTDAAQPVTHTATLRKFSYVPAHLPLPLETSTGGFSALLPAMQLLGAYLWGWRPTATCVPLTDAPHAEGTSEHATHDGPLPTSREGSAMIDISIPSTSRLHRSGAVAPSLRPPSSLGEEEEEMKASAGVDDAAAAASATSQQPSQRQQQLQLLQQHLQQQQSASPSYHTSPFMGDAAVAAVRELLTEEMGLELRFVEVAAIEPTLPDRFKLHCEAWVAGQGEVLHKVGEEVSTNTNLLYKTPFLFDREMMRWERNTRESVATFVVHRQDHVRIVLYEIASQGSAELVMMDYPNLWSEGATVQQTLELTSGSSQERCTLRVELRHVPLEMAKASIAEKAAAYNNKRAARKQKLQERHDDWYNRHFSLCSVM